MFRTLSGNNGQMAIVCWIDVKLELMMQRLGSHAAAVGMAASVRACVRGVQQR